MPYFARYLLVSLAALLNAAVAERPPEIKEYRTEITLNESTENMPSEFLSSLKTVLEEKINAALRTLTQESANKLVLAYDQDSTMRALEELQQGRIRNPSDEKEYTVESVNTAAQFNFQRQVAFTVSGFSDAIPKELPIELAKDVLALTGSPASDVKVLAAQQAFSAYLRIDNNSISKFEEAINSQQLNADWLALTAVALSAKVSDLKVDLMSIDDYRLARGYITIDYSDSPRKSGITELLKTDAVRDEIANQFLSDMGVAIGLSFADADMMIPTTVIVKVSEPKIIMAYDIDDPMMWTLGRRVKESASFPLTAVSAYLDEQLDTQGVQHVKIVAMEQQDVSTEGYASISATFNQLSESFSNRSLAPLEYALRNDLITAANLTKEDLFDVFIGQVASNYFEFEIEPNSATAFSRTATFLEKAKNDGTWLVEARAIEPNLTLTRVENGIDDGGNGSTRVVDNTCRVGGVHCDHIKGIVTLVVVTCVISALGYYFVIYRPSKKRQSSEVSELPQNHTFVFTRSLGASTHRSAASSFYGGTRGRAVPRPGQAEEVSMGQVVVPTDFADDGMQYQFDQQRLNQHPAAW